MGTDSYVDPRDMTLMLTLEIESLHTVNLSRYKMAIMSMIIRKDKLVYDKKTHPF